MKLFYFPISLFVLLFAVIPQLFGQQPIQLNQIESQFKQTTAKTATGVDQIRTYFSLNADAFQRTAIRRGNFINIQTDPSTTSTLEISRAMQYNTSTRSYIARDPENPENSFTFTYSNGRMNGIFHKSHGDVYYFEYDPATGLNYVAKNSTFHDDRQSCSIHEISFTTNNLQTPKRMGKSGNALYETQHIPNTSASVATLEDNVTIDILIPYTPKARAWAENSSYGSIDAVIAASLANSQTALDNSETNVTVRLVHQYETDYDADSSTSLDSDDPDYISAGEHLRRITYNTEMPINFCSQGDSSCDQADYAGFMEEAHDLRDQYGADLVAGVLSEPNTGGIAWRNSSPAGNQILGFSINRVQQIGSGYTLIHEIGHNMGNAHARNQPSAAADDFGGMFAYSTGNRYSNETNRYSTVMAYTDGGYQEIPYFSNPNVSFAGMSTGNGISFGGDAGPSDNARSMREIKRVIAAYRASVVDPPTINVNESSISATLDQQNRTVTVPVTIQNTGQSDMLWDFDFDIESSTISNKSASQQSNLTVAAADEADSLPAGGAVFSQTEHDGMIFSSSFEILQGFGPGDYASLGGWRSFAIDAPFAISNENASVGFQHLRLPRRSGSSSSVFARSPFFGPQPMAEYAVSFDISTQDQTIDGSGETFDAYLYDGSTGSISAGIIIASENIFAYSVNEQGDENFSFTNTTFPANGTYRSMEIKYNTNNQTVDYFLEGTQIASNPYPAGRKPDYIYFGQRNEVSGAHMDVDNIQIERVHSPFNWLTAQKFGGVIPAGESESVELTLTAQDVPTGSYEAVLQVRSNDPANPVIEVPISATIEMATSTENIQEVPQRAQLSQNYPNPFNPTTNIQFTLNRAANVTLEVFNITGQKVATLVNGPLNAGNHQHTFDASGLSSGIYMYRLQTPEQMLTRQMILIK
jgi:hypothetical protein